MAGEGPVALQRTGRHVPDAGRAPEHLRAIQSSHSLPPSRQRRPNGSGTRLSGMTRAATSTSEMATDATRLCGTRWNVRTRRRMVASTNRFQENIAAPGNPAGSEGAEGGVGGARISTLKTEEGWAGRGSAAATPPFVFRGPEVASVA